ncbi:hypothetical protein MMC14_006763 [Varicellaria rhodocarpa]|nr:hypothetical protein [Varicellaria rhodocarpa]
MKANFALNDGSIVPAVGLGTFQSDGDNSRVEEAVLAALKHGYRHIDTAAAYGNEKEIGRAIQRSGVSREKLFVTTKLAQTWHEPSEVAQALDQSLTALQLDYVPYAYATGADHETLRHPSGNGKPVMDYELSRAYPDVWEAMETLVSRGKVKSIGVSNFNILKLKRILDIARIVPAVNQVELHPFLPQNELLEFCTGKGIHLMAHQPLGGKPLDIVNPNVTRPGPLDHPKVMEIALKCKKSPAQVLISWAIQRGSSAIPKTIHEHRLIENIQTFKLNDEHLKTINLLSSETGTIRYLDPCGHIGFDLFDEIYDQPLANSVPWDI